MLLILFVPSLRDIVVWKIFSTGSPRGLQVLFTFAHITYHFAPPLFPLIKYLLLNVCIAESHDVWVFLPFEGETAQTIPFKRRRPTNIYIYIENKNNRIIGLDLIYSELIINHTQHTIGFVIIKSLLGREHNSHTLSTEEKLNDENFKVVRVLWVESSWWFGKRFSVIIWLFGVFSNWIFQLEPNWNDVSMLEYDFDIDISSKYIQHSIQLNIGFRSIKCKLHARHLQTPPVTNLMENPTLHSLTQIILHYSASRVTHGNPYN